MVNIYFLSLITYYSNCLLIKMSSGLIKDPFILDCCLLDRRQPYIGVDGSCRKSAVFCIEHSCHVNDEGLMHQMMPLRQFKRKIDDRKYNMQGKVNHLIQTFSKFIQKLIQEIRQIKLRKCLELSMLWLRDLSNSEQQYEMMKKIYRMDFQGLNCQDINSIYYKIIHNDALYSKELNQVKCYQGITKVLEQLSDSKKITKLLAEKITQIEGVLTNGQILKKVLPDKKELSQSLKQVLLEQQGHQQNFYILYNKSQLLNSGHSYSSFTSKYPLISHVTYHISATTRYSNIMLGICGQKAKQLQGDTGNLYYNESVIVFNFANGNTYKQGMFFAGSNEAIKGLNQINVKMRLTDNQVFLMTKKKVLMRERIDRFESNLYMIAFARTEGDQFTVHCDNDISADNVQVMNLIQEEIRLKHENQERPFADYGRAQVQQYSVGHEDSRSQPKMADQYSYKGSSSQEVADYKVPAFDRLASMGQILEEESQMENTVGDFKQSKREPQESQKFAKTSSQKVQKKEFHSTNPQINKIKADLHHLKVSISSQEKRDQDPKKVPNWKQQKDNYLKDIKSKITKLREKNEVKPQQKSKQITKQPKSIESNIRIPTQSSNFEKIKTGSEYSKTSKVKINLSDEASEFNSQIRMTILSGLRKGSDHYLAEDIKLKANSHMAESLEPRQMNKIETIKTPPKINYMDQKFEINQSFQF